MTDIAQEKNTPAQSATSAGGIGSPVHSSPLTRLETPEADTPLEKAEKLLITSERKHENRSVTTAGEHIHKWGTYLSIDWIFNAAAGVSFSYWGKFSETGKKYWSGPVTNGFKRALSPFIKNTAQLEKSAGYGNMFMSIIAGGMATIPPLMVLENNRVRKSIVKFWDGMIYGKKSVENDPKFQQAYDEIDATPKKDFVNGMLSRFAALSPLLAIVLIPSTKKISNRALFDHLENASGAVSKKIGFGEETAFKSLSRPAAKERLKFIKESMAMDVGLGLPYAVLHSYFYNLFTCNRHRHAASPSELSPQYTAEPPSLPADSSATSFAEMHRSAAKSAAAPSEFFTDKLAENKSTASYSPSMSA